MMDGASNDQKYHHIAQQRAQQFKKIRQTSNITRARSQDGQPVSYQKVKEKANITRHSGVMSDPDIPGTLVILNAKGLFQGKNVNGKQSKDEGRPVSLNMDEEASRPVFFDPSINNKEAKVSDLRKRFEAVECDVVGHSVNTGGDFLNPLHKVNQDLVSSTNKSLRKSADKKLEKVLNTETVEHDTVRDKGGHGGELLNPLHKINPDLVLNVDDKSRKNVLKKFEKVLGPPDASTKPSTSPPKEHKVITETVSEVAVKEPAILKPPLRPPPRAPKPDPLKRCRGESDPLPLDVNRVSRILPVCQQESLEEIVQEEHLPQGSSETEEVVIGNNENDNYDDNDDDDDDDEWDTDFDDDEDDEEERLKRSSQSSHESSGDAEPLVCYM